MQEKKLMEILAKLADVETAIDDFLRYEQFEPLRLLMDNPEYDEIWPLRFDNMDKYCLWQLLQCDPEAREARLRPYAQIGFRCGKRSPATAAPCISMLYAAEGSIECTLEDEHFVVGEHELCVINSETIMNFSTTGSDGFYISIFFNKLYLNNVMIHRFPSDSRFTPFFEQALFGANHGLDYLVFDLTGSERARFYLYAAIESFLLRPNCHEEIESSLIFLVFCELMNIWDKRQAPRQPQNNAVTAFEIVNYIAVNYRDVTLASIAEHFHFHPDTMRKMIKNLMNKNFIDVVQDIRLTAACEQLRKSSKPITQIIQDCGYQNASHFYTLFKERYHCSPAEYRTAKTGDK